MLDGSPLPTNAFIRDFQQRKAGYVVDAVEQALLFQLTLFFASFLPFVPFTISLFSLLPCFFPQQAVQAMFRAEEITNFYHWQMKEEEGR